MNRVTKLIIMSSLFLFFTTTTIRAAFPTGKSEQASVVAIATTSPDNNTVEKQVTAKEVKKQLKAEMHQNTKPASGGKSKIVAALLAIFLGSLGIHSFYMGQKTKGFVQLGLTVLGIVLFVAGIGSYVSGAGLSFPTTALIGYLLILGVGIWALVDFVRILTGGLAPEEGFND